MKDADVVTFVLAGCNAAEIAAYARISEETASARIYRAQMQIAHPELRLGRIGEERKELAA